MKQIHKRTLAAGTVATLLLIPAGVSAQEGANPYSSDTNSGAGTSRTSAMSPSPRTEKQRVFDQKVQAQLQEAKEKRQSTLTDKKEHLPQRLDEAKKKACENHKRTINRLMGVMDSRRQNAFDRITNVYEAVQEFSTEKQLTVANSDDLTAEVEAAKTAAITAVEVQKAIPDLNCSGEHPRADVADFKEKRADSTDAMKAYRNSVKHYVQAVKLAADEGNSNDQ